MIVMNIYVASSWRNYLQPAIVSVLRQAGHEVYDFRNPKPGDTGFSWSEIDPDWQKWTPGQYREALNHPAAERGYALDIRALQVCDACVLVLPSGRSASWEFGYAIGAGKQGAIVMLESCEPELMYRGQPILTTMDEVMDWAGLEIALPKFRKAPPETGLD
jgi:nucleoside 2-deoxyribosyltransferase